MVPVFEVAPIQQSRRRLRLSIFHKQAISFSVVVVITALATGLACYQFARVKLRDQIHRRLTTIAHDRALMLDAYVEQQKERVGLVASRTQLRNLLKAHGSEEGPPPDFFDETTKILRDAQANSKGFLDIRVTDETGMVIAATDSGAIGNDVSHLPEFQRGRQTRHLGEPRMVDGAYQAFLVGPAETNEGVFLGVVMVTLDVSPLQRILEDPQDASGHSRNTAGSRRGRLDPRRLEPSMQVLVGTREGDQIRYLFASSADEARQPTSLEEAEPMRTVVTTGMSDFGTLRHGDKQVLAAWQPVSYHLPEYRKWGMVVQVNEDEAYAPISLLAQILALVMVFLLPAAIALAYLIARRSSLPILRLADAAGEVARGDLGHQVPVDSSDEIGVLGKAFNLMNEQLNDSYRTLERRVQERTDELARSNRELEQFAYVASHDLQEPLRKIQSFSDLLVRHHAGQLDDEGIDYLRRMQNAAARMRSLINDLLAFARVSTAGQPFAPVDLNEVVRDVIVDLEARIAESSGVVHCNELPTIDADRTQMRQLFQNLIGNGLKYCRDGVPPVVRVTQLEPCGDVAPGQNAGVPDCCRIAFEDNGIGVPAEYAEKIFEPFQRLHGRGAYEGTGMGLALCRKIVERHGGAIALAGDATEGSKFVVTLPRQQLNGTAGD